MKIPLHGRRFLFINKVTVEVEHFIMGQNENFYNNGILQLIPWWEQFIALSGAYLEEIYPGHQCSRPQLSFLIVIIQTLRPLLILLVCVFRQCAENQHAV